MAQDTLYFPHDYDPLRDSKLRRLIKKHGAIGYAVYWRTVEYLHQNEDHVIRFDSGIYDDIGDDLSITKEQIDSIISDCISECGLIDADGEIFWSNRVHKNIAKRKAETKQRSDAGKASAEARRAMKEFMETHPEIANEFQRSLTPVNKERKKERNSSL